MTELSPLMLMIPPAIVSGIKDRPTLMLVDQLVADMRGIPRPMTFLARTLAWKHSPGNRVVILAVPLFVAELY
jgi:hypothetical protein